MKFKRALLSLLALTAAALTISAVGCSGSVAAGEAAKVNGRPVLKSILEDYTNQLIAEEKQVDLPQERINQLESQALEDLVLETLLLAEAEQRGLIAAEDEIESKLALIKQQSFGDDQQKFDEAMAAQGLNYDQARERVANAIAMEKLYMEVIGEASEVSDEEIATFYEANKEAFFEAEKRKLSHILFSSEAEAQNAKARLERGEDFGALAAELSKDTNTKGKGGDLGWIVKGTTAESFDAAAFSLSQGQISAPVRTASGWNLIQVDEIEGGGTPDLDQIKEDVRMALISQLGETAWTDWLDATRQEAEILYASEYRREEVRQEMPVGHP